MGRKSINNIRKPQILEHFRQVINEDGIHKASVVKIAKRMGVSPNLVLHYFESKDAMVMELFENVLMAEYVEYLREAISGVQKGPQRLKVLIKTMFGLGKNRELLIEKSFYAFYYLSLFDDQMQLRFNRIYRQLIDMVTTEIESCAKYRGTSQVDAAKQAEFLITLFEGFSFMANIRRNGDHFEEFGDYFVEKACEFFGCDLDE